MRLQVEAKGLRPFTTYNYQFTVCNSDNASPVGRTKTAPTDNAKLDELKLAVFSCSNYRMFTPEQRYVDPVFSDWAQQPTGTSTRTETPPERMTTTMLSTWATISTRAPRLARAATARLASSLAYGTTELATARYVPPWSEFMATDEGTNVQHSTAPTPTCSSWLRTLPGSQHGMITVCTPLRP